MELELRRAGFGTGVEHIPALVDVTSLRSPGDPDGELLLVAASYRTRWTA